MENIQYIKDIDKVLTLLCQSGKTLKLLNCHLFKMKMETFGHILMPTRLAAAFEIVDAISNPVILT